MMAQQVSDSQGIWVFDGQRKGIAPSRDNPPILNLARQPGNQGKDVDRDVVVQSKARHA